MTTMNQQLFDELIQFLLETVSSENYLKSLKIHRPSSVNWETFKKQVANQTVKPGIYPRSFGHGQGVHYYAVRREKDILQVGNGYPSAGGLKFSTGMDVQKDHSHGLCQTFALMFYLNEEKRLKKGNYFENVKIGLNFLQDFIQQDYLNRERVWDMDEFILSLKKHSDASDEERIDLYNSFLAGEDMSLLMIIDIIFSHPDHLKTWFS